MSGLITSDGKGKHIIEFHAALTSFSTRHTQIPTNNFPVLRTTQKSLVKENFRVLALLKNRKKVEYSEGQEVIVLCSYFVHIHQQ